MRTRRTPNTDTFYAVTGSRSNILKLTEYSNPKLFADDTSLFLLYATKKTLAKELNNDLRKISNWAYQWKMNSNPDPLKQAQVAIFSRKITKTNHPILILNDNPVHQAALQKYLGMFCRLQTRF